MKRLRPGSINEPSEVNRKCRFCADKAMRGTLKNAALPMVFRFPTHLTDLARSRAFLDGIEVYNGHIGHEERNFIAEQWANEYGLIKTSGTDMHYDYVPASGGILTEEKITDMKMLADVLRSGRYELLKSDKVR